MSAESDSEPANGLVRLRHVEQRGDSKSDQEI